MKKSLDIYPGKQDRLKKNMIYSTNFKHKWIFNYEEELNLTEAHNKDLCCVLMILISGGIPLMVMKGNTVGKYYIPS